MFDSLPVEVSVLRGSGDAAPLVDAAVGWGRVAAAAEAQRLACIAEWAAFFLAQSDDDTALCAVDEEDDVVAQIGIAFGVSVRWAMNDLQIAAAMKERFPGLAALFLRGEISAKVMATVVERTMLVWDPDALAKIDAACVKAAVECGWSGLSYYKLKNAVDIWIERHDPAAVRRARQTMQGRCVKAGDTNDKSGTTAVYCRLSAPGAALLMGRLRRMAKAVCKDDPRTLDQKMADALEALGADADHLKCLCGSQMCPATADDGVASRFVIHIYAEAAALDGEADPMLHGDGPTDTEQPLNVTTAPKPAETVANTGEAEPPENATKAEAAPERPKMSTPRQRPISAVPPPTMTNPSAGVIPGFGVVPNALIAALLVAGATVSYVKPPAVEPENHPWISKALREFVKSRDLTCRIPGCDRAADWGDLDHSIAWGEGGPTHGSNLNGKCRHHHMIKTFRDGWSEIQKPDGTILFTTPTGHTYVSEPTSRLFFPTADTTSVAVERGSPRKEPAADKTVKMPKRKRPKAKERAYRIAAERALNDAAVAERNKPPPF
ncbi:HNH endonuclease signature motif containing protein [Mycolicibacterium mengxianglii]|uniref:HNH endonuclease signature motif containing protein n=1 Tax=Mycolicibacterium mengxianglii TaxID=2736649 RepID=UPI0018D102F7|nr:HNH endonuclease signature motif containing protein [Mycolicibacterium mengxianglii]